MVDAGIVFTAYNRPHYLKETLDSWYRTSRSLPVMFQVEPDYPPVIDICQEAKFEDVQVIVNDMRLGALLNPRAAMNSAFFRGFDFVILAEDDTVVSPDVIEYFMFAAEKYKDDPDIPLVCTFTHDPKGGIDKVFRQHWFGSPVWGTWRKHWEYIEPNWSPHYGPAWDKQLVDLVSGERWAIFPAISRSQLIGKYDGTHLPPEQFEELRARTFYMGRAPSEYREVFNV